jgi:hypothetical protein
MNRPLRLTAATLLVCVMAYVLGCDGSSKTKVSGKLLMNGKPLSVSKQTIVTLTFAPDVETKGVQTTPAKYARETGTYEVELTPGKYRVSCLLRDTEKNQKIPTGPTKVYDLSSANVVDIDVTPE